MTKKLYALRAVSRAALSMRNGALLRFIATICLTYAIPALATTWEDATGPYATTVVANAGPEHAYYIYRPATLKPGSHPIAVLCPGSGVSPSAYDPLLAELASHGVIVIADSSASPDDGSKASAAVNWLLEQNETSGSEYFGKLMPSKVLAIGHSMGGTGAVSAAILNSRIKSVLLYAPSLSVGRSAELSVPTFFIAGSLDNSETPAYVKARYQETTKANAWYGEASNQGHTGFVRNSTVQYFTRAWVYTHLFDDSGTARGCFYGPNWSLQNAPNWKEALKNNSVP